MKPQELAAIRELPVQELLAQLRDCEEKLVRKKISNAVSPLKNGLEITGLRRHRARLMTWIRQKELAGSRVQGAKGKK